MNKAIFFDRDDTLIKDSGYMYKLEDLEFLPDTFEVLQTLQKRGYLLFIVTNQSGIGRGYYTEDDMHKFNNHMLEKLAEKNIKIKEIAFCPHSPEDHCECRKPSPKLLNILINKYSIDRSSSWMIGDKESDVSSGQAAKLNTFKFDKKLSLKFKMNIFE